ncbi:hypothetical protein T08_323 [Trichinella sp. T8]|nr:hypothetical protein T08_323 [Trichinella sp. T8]
MNEMSTQTSAIVMTMTMMISSLPFLLTRHHFKKYLPLQSGGCVSLLLLQLQAGRGHGRRRSRGCRETTGHQRVPADAHHLRPAKLPAAAAAAAATLAFRIALLIDSDMASLALVGAYDDGPPTNLLLLLALPTVLLLLWVVVGVVGLVVGPTPAKPPTVGVPCEFMVTLPATLGVVPPTFGGGTTPGFKPPTPAPTPPPMPVVFNTGDMEAAAADCKFINEDMTNEPSCAHESLLEAARVFGFEQLTLVGANALFASNAAEVDLPAGREVDKTLRAAERGLHFGLLERKSRDGGHVYRLGIFLLFWRCRRELTVPLFDRHHALDHLVQTEQVQKVGLVGIRDEIHFRRRRLGRRYLKQGLFELFAQGELGRGAALGRRLATVNEAGLLGSLSGRCLGGGLRCRHALSLNTGNAGSRVFGRGRTELTAGSREIRHALGASADHFHGTAVLLHRRRRGSSSGGRGRCGRMA